MTAPANPPQPYASSAQLATYMQVEDVEPAWHATATMLLGFAALLIRTEYTDIDSRDPAIDPELPKLVSLELVSNKMIENAAGGVTQVTESMEDISVTKTLGKGQRFGGLALDEWARSLLAPEPSSGPRAFAIKRGTGRVPNNPYDNQALGTVRGAPWVL
ncbi:Uncharacterised protein [Mycobacteroides abscessus subsp. abscessus]|uniref:hypothetical protein n=1 Tax=Mycobacteroides abscessus TaxID=36809 RepID=UPI000928C72D|nr:hypothetical protein [Mycobacteroides abscessus]SIE44536.1 Uncharacterised protein [Mycobacteroides abscessus subsp. abscessus]SKV19598.1 Uncharacterised protein [Mycobacteroides abscessus subsp. abscessus]SLD72217.1 Uncharacterised protein [Mycobacteroides abscessus subsp. massiliense]